MEIFENYHKLLETLSHKKGIIFLLGETDTGKTTFTKNLIDMYTAKGKKVCFLDSDVGQSTIGPPTTIGLKVIKNREDNNFNDFTKLYFVGSTSPRGFFLPMVVGTYKLSRIFLKDVDATIIDTTGLVSGQYGQTLKFYKIDLILPRYLVLFEKEDELKPYREIFKSNKLFKTFVLKVPVDKIKQKSYEERANYRIQKFESYFKDGKDYILDLKKLSSFPPIYELKNQIQKFNILGLEDNDNNLLGIGIFLDFRKDEKIRIFTPVNYIDKINFLKLSYFKVTRTGKRA